MLQTGRPPKDGKAVPFVSDFFDFSVYIDATEDVLERWYVERFLALRLTAFRDPMSYFHRYSRLSDEEAVSDRQGHLEPDQSRQSAREHPADTPARRPDPHQERAPLDRRSGAAAVVIGTQLPLAPLIPAPGLRFAQPERELQREPSSFCDSGSPLSRGRTERLTSTRIFTPRGGPHRRRNARCSAHGSR